MARIVNDLEVPDEAKVPFKLMRYPVISGEKRKLLFEARAKWFKDKLGLNDADADHWTSIEFKAFFSTEDNLIDQSDPGDLVDYLVSIKSITDEPWDPNFLEEVKRETERFFVSADDGLIRKTPMKTYPQMRYGTTTRIDLLRDAELPDKLDYWSHNAGKFINIITQERESVTRV